VVHRENGLAVARHLGARVNDLSLHGRVCLVTGATSGIGRAVATELARRGAELFIPSRDLERAASLVQSLQAETPLAEVTPLACDLSSLSDVRSCAETFLALGRPLHLLVNNAAVFNTRRHLTVDGHEEMFAVNHLAHYLLSRLLLERLGESGPARIVNVASEAHILVRRIQVDDLSFARGLRPLTAYSHSKLANILFTLELTHRLANADLAAFAVHPGNVGTRLGAQNGWFGAAINRLMRGLLRPPTRGARPVLHAALLADPSQPNGFYFDELEPAQPRPWARDVSAARHLWDISAELTGLG